MLLALAIRLSWSALASHLDPFLVGNPYQGDGIGYASLGWNLKNGGGFSWDTINPTSYRMPGYPVILALVFAIAGLNPAAVRFLHSILGALTVLPVYYIATQLGGTRVGILAAGGVALFPLLIYITGWIYSETLLILLLWTGLAILVSGLLHQQGWVGFLAGGILGLATLVRPESALIPLAIAACGWLLRWKWPLVRIALLAQLGLIVVILPWAVRNITVQRQFVPLTTSGGSNFYAGNNPEAQGGSAWQFPLEGKSELESDRELARRAFQWIRENPEAAAVNVLRKIQKFFSPIALETMQSPFHYAWIFELFYLGFLALAGWGAWKTFRTIPGTALAILVMWYLVIAIIFYGGSRVALPVAPALITLAAYPMALLLWKRTPPKPLPGPPESPA